MRQRPMRSIFVATAIFFLAALVISAPGTARADSTGASKVGLARTPDPPYFEEVSAQVGVAGIPAFRVTFGDLDMDGYDDMIVHKRGAWLRDNAWVMMNRPATGRDGRVFVDFTEDS